MAILDSSHRPWHGRLEQAMAPLTAPSGGGVDVDESEPSQGRGEASFDFTGRRVLVTGGGSGVGLATARAFSAAGADVVVIEVTEAAAAVTRATVPGVQVDAVDVTDATGLRELVSARGDFDVVVNNAMICGDDDFLSATPEQMRREIDVNLMGPILVSQAVLPGMITRGDGVIVNISSINAALHLGNEAYSAAKSGLQSLTRSIATEFGPDGVRCNTVALGTVETPAWTQRRAADPGVFARLSGWYPLRRVGTVADAAAAVMFLASDAARWVTGTVLTVDGGFTAGNLRMSADIRGHDDQAAP
jgi:NAD(P)-dependent dehydrogenase (short-subunit alcohol dehydrogenase family)